MFTRREALIGLTLYCALPELYAQAAKSNKIRRIGILSRGSQQEQNTLG
jgi:hypothetical protein